MKKSILVFAAISAALLTAYEAGSMVSGPAPRAIDGGLPGNVMTGKAAPDQPLVPAIESAPGALAIREAHSDGGYWYWAP